MASPWLNLKFGDYALYMNVWANKRDKLSVTWCGPAVVSEIISEWIFKVRNLVTGEEREAHSSRLRFFNCSLVDTSADILDHIAYNSEEHIVKDFISVEKNDETLEWDVFVSWRGLGSTEDSWEPVDSIMRDVPAHFTK